MKINYLLLAVFLFLIGFASAAFSGTGAGTLANPYVITNCTQLQEMNLSLTANYYLANDITVLLQIP